MSPARFVSVRPSVTTSLKGDGDAVAERGDEPAHQLAAAVAVGFAVGGDHGLVDGPGGFDLDVLIAAEQSLEPGCCLSLSRSGPVCSIRRELNNGSRCGPGGRADPAGCGGGTGPGRRRRGGGHERNP
jgi:hypothetical protein